MQNLRPHRNAVELLQAALAGVLLPATGATHLQIRSFLVAAATSLLVIGLTFGSHVQGALPWNAFLQVALAIVIAVLAFYFVFRSGLNRAAADPSLTVHQMVVSTLVMMYALYSAEAGAGGVFLVILLMIFMCGLVRLRTTGMLRFALFVLVAHAATIVLRSLLHPAISDMGMRLLQWLTLACTLPWFALMGGHVKGLRDQLRKGNGLLREVLRDARESESRLAEAQRIAGLGSWTFDKAAQMAHWSPEMYRILGLDQAQAVPRGDEFLRHVHPEDRTRYLESFRPAIHEGHSFDGEYRIVLPGGEVRWVHVVGEPEVDATGGTTMLRGTAIDITERMAQELALRQARDDASAAKRTLDDAIRVLPAAFALYDADDRLTQWNRRYEEITTDSCKLEVVLGMRYEAVVRACVANGEMISPEFADDVEGYIADRVRLHRNPPETREVRAGGGRWLQVSEGHTASGGIVGVRIDITERKHLEQRQEMEHTVTRLLAESESVGGTMAEVIRTVCEALGWDCGARWELDARDDMLHCVDTWSVSASEIAAFSAYCTRQTLAPASSGLVRRALTTGRPVWIADVAGEPGFQRAAAAAAAGLHGAFAFPIRVGSRLVGAMEFFVRNVRQPDAALLRVLTSIGLQLGQYLERAAAQERLHHRARYDDLTGLANRGHFNELLTRALVKAERHGSRLAILFVDLDGFKAINDRHGHDAGDRLLATFSERLRMSLRDADTIARRGESDTAARLGGDEFVILINDIVRTTDLAALANRILAAAAKPFDLGGRHCNVTASIGIGVFPDDARDVEGLIKVADSAMYAAKDDGRNGFRFHGVPSDRQIALVS